MERFISAIKPHEAKHLQLNLALQGGRKGITSRKVGFEEATPIRLPE